MKTMDERITILEHAVANFPMSIDQASIELDKPKKIDMSVCIESGIDCEFAEIGCEYDLISPLVSIGNAVSDKTLYFSHEFNHHKLCRPRMNHIHASPTGWDKCPIPEGFIIEPWNFTGALIKVRIGVDSINWKTTRMFEVTGIAEGYEL